MSGKSKSVNDWKELPEHIYKYCNEYQTSKKIIPALREAWGLVYYSRYTRGFYVSFTLTLDQLVYEAEKRRKTVKDKQRKEQEKEAVKKAMERLNKPLASSFEAPLKPLPRPINKPFP